MASTEMKTSESAAASRDVSQSRDSRSAQMHAQSTEALRHISAEKADKVNARIRVRRPDLILFTTQLSIMLDSGVILSDALEAIAKQTQQNSPVLSIIVSDICEQVKSGESFSSALENYPRVFNSMFLSMVRASEASGKMVEMLTVLTDYLNFELETRKQIKSAMTYPFIMALMAVAATGTLMFFVLPRFIKIYDARGAALPKLTQVIVGFSTSLGDPDTMSMVLGIAIPVLLGIVWWAGTQKGKMFIDYLKIRTPVLGTVFVDTVVARSMRIMATMVNTGVSLLDSIEVMCGATDNYYFKKLWREADKQIQHGYQLSEAIELCEHSHLIAPGIIQMLRAGEKSGKLGLVSDRISVFYEKKLEASIRNLMTLIEPVMITILGAIIGTIAIALLLPVFRISTVVSQ